MYYFNHTLNAETIEDVEDEETTEIIQSDELESFVIDEGNIVETVENQYQSSQHRELQERPVSVIPIHRKRLTHPIKKRKGGGKEYINYYNILMNDIDKINIQYKKNYTFIMTYLWLFKLYEFNVCMDEEQLKMDFDNIHHGTDKYPYYIPTHKELYYYFYYILKFITDISTQNAHTIQFEYIEIALLHESIINTGGNQIYQQIQQLKSYAFDNKIKFFTEQEITEIIPKISGSTLSNLKGIVSKSIQHSALINSKIGSNSIMSEILCKELKERHEISLYTFTHMYTNVTNILSHIFSREEEVYQKTLKSTPIPEGKIASHTKIPQLENTIFKMNPRQAIHVYGGKYTKKKKYSKKHTRKNRN